MAVVVSEYAAFRGAAVANRTRHYEDLRELRAELSTLRRERDELLTTLQEVVRYPIVTTGEWLGRAERLIAKCNPG